MEEATHGMEFGELTSDYKARMGIPDKVEGIVITDVQPWSTGAEAHLEKGDVVWRAGHTMVKNLDDLKSALGDREQTVLLVYRGKKSFPVVLFRPFHPDGPDGGP
jgi:S1-C subfamily serine protease